MKRFAGKPCWDIPKGLLGEEEIHQAYGHFGILPTSIALLKVHTKVEALDTN